MPVIRPRYDPQLNCSIGGNFNIHPPSFSMDGRFLFTMRRNRSQCKIFLIFTLHWLDHSHIKRDRAEFCLIDPIVRQVWLLTAIARPAPDHQKVCKKRRRNCDKWPQEEQSALVSLWAERHELLESKDARKVWEEIARELNRKFGTKGTGDKKKEKEDELSHRAVQNRQGLEQ